LDAEGKVVSERPVPPLDREKVEAALARFRGTFAQQPPMYSAVKVGGKRLYELARAGEEVDRASREVTVRELVLQDFSAAELRLTVTATKGFFVRSLAFDVGEALGCGAHLVALRRTRSGTFSLAQAVPLSEVGAKGAARLVPVAQALGDIPSVRVSASDAQKVRHGGVVEVAAADSLVRVLGPGDELLALADVERGRLRYRRVLAREG
jgi:tRNA pseudouridine55 synthase